MVKSPELSVERGGVASTNVVVEDETDKLGDWCSRRRWCSSRHKPLQAQIARIQIVCRSARTSVNAWVPTLTGVTGHRHVMVNQPFPPSLLPELEATFFFFLRARGHAARTKECILCPLRGPRVAPRPVCSRTSSDSPPAGPKRPPSSHRFHH